MLLSCCKSWIYRVGVNTKFTTCLTIRLVFKRIFHVFNDIACQQIWAIFVYWVKVLHIMITHNVDFCRNELSFRPITIFHLNPLPLLMIKMTIKHFFPFVRNWSRGCTWRFLFQSIHSNSSSARRARAPFITSSMLTCVFDILISGC